MQRVKTFCYCDTLAPHSLILILQSRVHLFTPSLKPLSAAFPLTVCHYSFDCAARFLSRRIMINLCRYAKLRIPVGHCVKSIRGNEITTSTCLQAKDVEEVPVATYAQNKKSVQRTVLSVDKSKSAPSHVSTKDIQRTATPFDRTIVPRMTPSLKAFLLEDKVAVVTGYVLTMIHACFPHDFYIPLCLEKWFLFGQWSICKIAVDDVYLDFAINYCQLC